MALYLSKPSYRCKPIRSVAALARALKSGETELKNLAERANQSYRIVLPKPGSSRQTFDALGALKTIQRRIQITFFNNVTFPDYLHGSLKGCDYVTNASLHTNKQLLICEDVKKFFPSVSATKVKDVWCAFFGFSPEVADLLTTLTTKDGALPQGAITSSYLANLVLWRDEPLLHAKLAAHGITYSRYVDDMAMSSANHLSKELQTWVIAQVYGMLHKNGLNAGRAKHEIFSASEPMIATKLIVNNKPSLNQKKRSQVRAQIRQLELAQLSGADFEMVRQLATKAAQRVGQLGRFHDTQARHLKSRILAVREVLPDSQHSIATYPKDGVPSPLPVFNDDDRAPWD
jgi:ribosomal protein S20